MREKNKENLTLEDYENEFSYKANKSNLNISFNRIAFIFFIFLMICSIYSIKAFYLGSLNSKQKIKNIEQTEISQNVYLGVGITFWSRGVLQQIMVLNDSTQLDQKIKSI